MYKFVRNSKFSKALIAKHLSMLNEVNSLFALYSSRGRFMVLMITALFDIYQRIFVGDCYQ